MSICTNILRGGSNNHETTSENANQVQTDFVSEGIVGALTNTSGVAPATGGFAVNAQGTPDMTVAVSSGVAYVTATPSGQASQTLRVYNNASANVTISANSSGSTKYDWIYIAIDADNANDPNEAGDDVASLVTSRSSSASSDDGTPPTYGYPIAVVTVANGASSITNGNISDIRERTGTTTTTKTNAVGTITTTTSANNRSTTSTSFATLTDTIALTAGKWELTLKTYARITNTSGSSRDVFVTLSSDASTETHPKLTQNLSCSVDAVQFAATLFTSTVVTLSGNTTFTLMGKVSGTNTTLAILGATQSTIIEARKLSSETS